MTHARVEAGRVDDEAALALGARDADGPASLELRDLPDHAAHGARRRRHDDGLAGPRAAEVEQADVRGKPGHAENAERRPDRRLRGLERPRPGAGRHRVALPAIVADDEVAGLEGRVGRLDHLADGAAHHHLAEVDRLRVRASLAHAAAHVRIEREVDRPTEHLAVAGPDALSDDLQSIWPSPGRGTGDSISMKSSG